MALTPTKESNTSFLQSITPVRFLDSPKIKQDVSAYKTCKTRLDLILKTLQDNYAKWQLAQRRGLALCTSIEAIKTRSLESANKTTDTTYTLYPTEMKPYCDKLCIIVGIFDDIVSNARESIKQLRALNKMANITEQIFYRTWKIQQFIDFVEHLLQCYEQEAKVKRTVMLELPHSLNRANLIRWTTAWEYPIHVDSHIALCFAFINEELKVQKT